MALLQVTFMSQSLQRNVPLMAVLPADVAPPAGAGRCGGPYRTLYLLHGIYGSCLSWTAESRIKRLAEERNIAVIMPSGDNGFYVDRAESYNRYGEFVGKELVDITRRMFPLSAAREDTFIAGLSMGGFGALRNGLKYRETFGRIAAFSSALVLEQALSLSYDEPHITRNRGYFESCFGDIGEALKSDRNPKELVRALKEEKAKNPLTPVPEIFMSCGTEDPLLPNNRDFRDFLEAAGFGVTYVETPGAHDWDFWDEHIERALGWMLPVSRP